MAANDLRGWVMSGVSGVACVLGAAVICVDVVLRRVTHNKSFQIANSNNFLSASLCLSAGVMLFTSLYSMLPTSKEYLTRASFSPSASAYLLTGLFIAGVVVIRVASGLLHRFIPSHVVDCSHSHGGPENDPERGEGHQEEIDHHHGNTDGSTEQTPLLRPQRMRWFKSTPAVLQQTEPVTEAARRESLQAMLARRESLQAMLTRRISALMGGVKPLCDENGPCYGVSQTCGRECTKVLPPPSVSPHEVTRPPLTPQHHSLPEQLDPESRAEADMAVESVVGAPETGYFDAVSAQHQLYSTAESSSSSGMHQVQPEHHHHDNQQQYSAHEPHDHHHNAHNEHQDDSDSPPSKSAGDSTHHHHVPQNAFLSIGLQTSLAIALHKLPEGFITYATNHASPTLGLTVFVALFIHNIVEGFAMALPLYLALSSRWKAMFWSSLLGGISQPAGAGLAALWLWGSRHSGHDAMGPSWGIYGGMFAATAGVMTSVALQLFSEGLGLTHRRGMGIGFAVAGMGLMGLSFALTA
ncbi:uncharacterized protein N7459_001913 [Penicillium hispanicum]|uniref:uncharacterized protein n=1 Tax=Penicillium hispanicum TaxID=1080232 RepID=UPI002540CA96|nr:uncharacterized protein N7459_001913 [Penicillium hispanicum]KAJ5591544.1 hypothetical protein N7459_001913 [Penicillium hispanicum]